MAFPGPMRVFHEVVKAGSIRKASETLNTAPSSVSRQIAILEHQIGTALFDRTASGLVPTHAGQLVAEYARTVVLDYDGLRSDLNDLRGTRRVQVRIAVVENMVCEGAVTAIRAFHESYSDVTFKIDVLSPRVIAEGLKSGMYDVGISLSQAPDPELTPVMRLSDPVMLAAAPQHPIASSGLVGLTDLARIPMAFAEGDPGFDLVDRAFREDGLIIKPLLMTNSIEAVRSFVRGGTGISLLSKRTVKRDEDLGAIVTVPVDSPALMAATIDVLTLKNRRLPRIVRLLVNQVSDTLKRLK